MTQEALKLALDALEDFSHKECCDNGEGEIGSRVCCEVLSYKAHDENCKVIKAITAIKEALAQEQEPVADDFFRMIADKNPKPFPLPQRTWAGLTDEEIDAIYTGVRAVHRKIDSDVFARAIEAKLKELNDHGI